MRAVEDAGGLPVVLAPGRPEDAADLLDRLQGLVLTGGADVDPALYGEPAHETVTDVTASETTSSWRSAARPCGGTCPSWLSVGASRC